MNNEKIIAEFREKFPGQYVERRSMKEVIWGGVAIVVGTAVMLLAGYALFGVFSWMFSDPFDWVRDKENEDVRRCREEGGFAIQSGWSGYLKRCEFKKDKGGEDGNL